MVKNSEDPEGCLAKDGKDTKAQGLRRHVAALKAVSRDRTLGDHQNSGWQIKGIPCRFQNQPTLRHLTPIPCIPYLPWLIPSALSATSAFKFRPFRFHQSVFHPYNPCSNHPSAHPSLPLRPWCKTTLPPLSVHSVTHSVCSVVNPLSPSSLLHFSAFHRLNFSWAPCWLKTSTPWSR